MPVPEYALSGLLLCTLLLRSGEMNKKPGDLGFCFADRSGILLWPCGRNIRKVDGEMEDREREILVMAVQLLLCAVYVIFQFSRELKIAGKAAEKTGEASASKV